MIREAQVDRAQDLILSSFVDGSSSVRFARHRKTGGMIRQSAAMAVATDRLSRRYQTRLTCFPGVHHDFSGRIVRAGTMASFTLNAGQCVRSRRMASNAVCRAFIDRESFRCLTMRGAGPRFVDAAMTELTFLATHVQGSGMHPVQKCDDEQKPERCSNHITHSSLSQGLSTNTWRQSRCRWVSAFVKDSCCMSTEVEARRGYS